MGCLQLFYVGPLLGPHPLLSNFSSVKAITPVGSFSPHHGNIYVLSERGERLMRYYENRMEWETFFQVKVDVLLLCSEMGINLKSDEQNPRSTHAANDW